MIITIGGTPGSGKSTVAKLVAKKLKYKFYSAGDLRGELATREGLTIDELNDLNAKWTQTAVDDQVKRIGENEDNLVFDSWLGWHFIPHSKKIFLKVDEDVAAERIFKDQRPDEEHQNSASGVKKMLANRVKVWTKQIKKFYKVDVFDENNYDLVIDTTNLTPEEVVDKIVEFVKRK